MKFLREKLVPRLYQEKIFHKCVNSNCLVVLPTGLGKTIVALMLTAYQLGKHDNSRVLFLAPTKPLVEQHFKTFSGFFKHESGELLVVSGEVSPEQRQGLYSDAVVVFATPQTIENDLITRKLVLDNYSLVIYDECHRGVGDYAYTFINDVYKKQGVNRKILGLSASPGTNSEKITQVCENLGLSSVVYKDEKDSDVSPYVKKKKIKKIIVELPESLNVIKNGLDLSLKKRFKLLKSKGLLKTLDVNKVNKRDLLSLQKKLQGMISGPDRTPDTYENISLVAEALKLSFALELLQTQGVKPLINYFNKMKKQFNVKANRSLFSDEDFREAVKHTYNIEDSVEHPKFEKLKEIISEKLVKDEKFIIFTNYRDTARRVVDYLKDNTSARPVVFIGQAGKEGLSQKKQLSVLEDFGTGKYNVLVSTSVGEEGLHVPSVEYAVFFEPVPSGLRMIQRKGRVGRTKVGEVMVMYTKGCIDEKYYFVSKHREKRMRNAINNASEIMNSRKQKSLGEF